MESMSIDPAAAVVGSELVAVASRALGAGGTALPVLTGLAPAGAEEVSLQAALAFAAEAEAMLALNAAAQEELARAGLAVTEIARMYAQVDGEAAASLAAGGTRFVNQAFATGTGATAAGGLIRAETLPGAAGSAARTPLLANLIGGVAAANPSTAAAPAGMTPAAATPATVATAASTVLGAGAAPLGSIGQFTSAGGAAGPATAATAAPGLASSANDDRNEKDRDAPADEQPGERPV